ncbi:MAG: ankyrin repeat domain-containing protein [Alphaproteobacteria bacterium]|nr:MAG: ankyrin repeat domain-containing protein [Alphaproteobacteria bacterium]
MYEVLKERLFDAIQNEDIAAIDAALADGANINAHDGFGETPLIRAVHKDPKILHHLLKRNADVHVVDNFYNAPISVAVFYNRPDAAQLLLAHGSDADHVNNYGETPLIYTAKYDYPEIAKLLLEHGADPERAPRRDNKPLDIARNAKHETVAVLIEEALQGKLLKEEEDNRRAFEKAQKQKKGKALQNTQGNLRNYLHRPRRR